MRDGRTRAVIENVAPQVDCGRFPIKRVVGESVTVRADVLVDGHDLAACAVRWRREAEAFFTDVPMRPVGNDRYQAEFVVGEMAPYRYRVVAWVDHFGSWLRDLEKKAKAGQELALDLAQGARLAAEAAQRAPSGQDRDRLTEYARALGQTYGVEDEGYRLARDPQFAALMNGYPDLAHAAMSEELAVAVDPPKALFSAWYELFPRSAADPAGGRPHGTFKDVERLMPGIAAMGFDVLYLPPVHPIGSSFRKGRNNAPAAQPGEPGSPWAIGAAEGGHMAVHPELGTLADFRELVDKAQSLGLDLAIDVAFQCSPDHPWVSEHPEWFRRRADGSVQYAENPPKKYQDVYPFDFECRDWKLLWKALRDVFLFWGDLGVRVFRVDNPHTKPLPFWEWVIADVKRAFPESIFLAEAFTRPKVMYRLAKAGFTQSYTYFTWRNAKWELTQYLTELTQSPAREFFRPNFWPNTPDILPEFLQYGGRPAFVIRLVLAATLSSNYGIYGPAFELLADEAVPGTEEYLNSEKYEIRAWDREAPGNLKGFMARLNAIRRAHPALQTTWNLRFLMAENENVLFYAKEGPPGPDGEPGELLLVAVSLDPRQAQTAWLRIPAEEYGVDPAQSYMVHDLLGDDRFIWQGERNQITLDPRVLPARIFRLRRRLRRETDFDYFM